VTGLSDRAAIVTTVGILFGYGIARSAVIADSLHFVTNTAMIGVVAAVAAAARLSRDDVGLSTDALRGGLRMGGLAVIAVGIVVATGVMVIADDSALVRDHVGLSASDVLIQALIEIPIATVLLEELVFRGVLGALFHRIATPWRAVAGSSVLFGLWHVPGAWSAFDLEGVASLVAVVAVTTVAGVVFQLMKDRTRSLAAPCLAHWATNGLSLLVVWTLIGN
jgi:membrane protease YdiL (CAAX protease family)